MKTAFWRVMAWMVGVMVCAQMASAGLTNRYVVKGNSGAAVPYDTLGNAAPDIQTAINYANTAAGSTVLVAAATYDVGGTVYSGRYLTNRVLINKAITVRSIDNNPATTIIQGAWNSGATNGKAAIRCVWMLAGSSLVGFTLTNGATWTSNDVDRSIIGQDSQAGGVYAQNATATLSNCVITGNASFGDAYQGSGGGGAYAGTFYNCIFRGNWSAYGGGGTWGSVLSNCTLVGNSTPGPGGGADQGTLYGCVVSNNTAGPANAGGGVAGWSAAARVYAYNCTIVNNRAGAGAGASLAFATNCTFAFNVASNVVPASSRGGGAGDSILVNCQVISNRTYQNGGGVYGGTLTNCTVAYNVADLCGGGICYPYAYNCLIYGNSGYGGGVYMINGNQLHSCTIAGNNTSGILSENANSTNPIVNCIIYSNFNGSVTANWVTNSGSVVFQFTNSCTIPAFPGWAAGNITNNPRLVSYGSGNGPSLLDADYHLSSGSPCVNAGVIETWMPGAGDLDGNKRVDPGSLLVDMGCYERVLPGGTLIWVK